MNESQKAGLDLASVALDPDELALAVRRTMQMNLASKAVCRSYGPKNGCHCRGDDARCHAPELWADEARAVVMAFEKMGWLTSPPKINPAPELTRVQYEDGTLYIGPLDDETGSVAESWIEGSVVVDGEKGQRIDAWLRQVAPRLDDGESHED